MNFSGLLGHSVTVTNGTQGVVVGWENDQLVLLTVDGLLVKAFYWDVVVVGAADFTGLAIE